MILGALNNTLFIDNSTIPSAKSMDCPAAADRSCTSTAEGSGLSSTEIASAQIRDRPHYSTSDDG